MASVLATMLMSAPRLVPSLVMLTQLFGRARSAFTRTRCSAQVIQNRSSCQTKRCMTPTGHPSVVVHISTASVWTSKTWSRLSSSTVNIETSW